MANEPGGESSKARGESARGRNGKGAKKPDRQPAMFSFDCCMVPCTLTNSRFLLSTIKCMYGSYSPRIRECMSLWILQSFLFVRQSV